MSTTYTPQPGTISFRAIEALKLMEVGAEVPTVVMLELLGQPKDWAGLTTCLSPAVDAGLISRRTEGRRIYWSLGDGEPLSGSYEIEAPTPTDEAEAAAQVPATTAHADQLPPTAEEAGEDLGCEFAITSTGRLLIDCDGKSVALSKHQADHLMTYLDQARGIEWEVAA
ncbi:hypothetical protein [Aquabacterium sp.]|uniref:hypothetical protein n=1 Tax=Aquabacterium sp. TaxID=1872578 RepID=UPI003D0140DA